MSDFQTWSLANNNKSYGAYQNAMNYGEAQRGSYLDELGGAYGMSADTPITREFSAFDGIGDINKLATLRTPEVPTAGNNGVYAPTADSTFNSTGNIADVRATSSFGAAPMPGAYAGYDGATDPAYKSWSGFSDANNDGRWNGWDSQQRAKIPITADMTPVQKLDTEKANALIDTQNQANQFDFTGAANIGMSAFNAYNQYNQQNDILDMYKKDFGLKKADYEDRKAARSSWSTGMANAGKK